MKHLITLDHISRVELIDLWSETTELKKQGINSDAVTTGLKNKLITNLFYEPSTRTSSSFLAAVCRQGGIINQINNVEFSSVVKGESLIDTVRTLGYYSDAIVLRSRAEGDALIASKYSQVPIINAGDGVGEHPTQTILDGFTIIENFKHIDDLTITIAGDLKNSRTVHSLVKLLAKWENNKFNFVSPKEYRLPNSLLELVRDRCIETENLSEVASNSDVFYITRIQRERGSDFSYSVTLEDYSKFKNNCIVMHPLPRNEELPTWMDNKPQARYFNQVENGMWTRMVLLRHLLR